MSRWSRLSRHLPMRARPATADPVLILLDDQEGHGPAAWPGQTVTVSVAAWRSDGRSLELPGTVGERTLVLGEGAAIRGLEHALRGMRVGGCRRVEVPPALAFGTEGRAGAVPPGATLVLEIRLLGATPTPPPRVG